jgi:hypothetical protein
MDPYAPVYPQSDLSRGPRVARARPERGAARELELQARERRAQRRRELVSRALAVVAARRRDYDGELAGRVG